MARAIFNGAVVADSDEGVVVEGNYYFPRAAVKREYLQDSETHTTCPWKGEASYHDIVVDGRVARDGAWYYPSPKDAARQIKDHVAFWKDVKVER